MHKFSAETDECHDAGHGAEPVRDRQWRHIGETQSERSECFDDQFREAEGEKHVRRRRRNTLMAVWMAIEIEKRREDPNRDGQRRTPAILDAGNGGKNRETNERCDREAPKNRAESMLRRE